MEYLEQSTSLGDLLRRSCLHWKDTVSHHVRVGKDYQPVTYQELWEKVRGYAAVLHAEGLRRGDRICILGETSFEWAVTDWAAQTLGITTIPIYPTLPPNQAQYIFGDCEAALVVLGSEKLGDKLPGVRTLTTDQLTERAKTATLPDDVWMPIIASVGFEELATIIYTSGTTGNPKGAMLCHRTFVRLLTGISQSVPLRHGDTFLSFLPLSHVFERANGHFLPIALGATVAYAGGLASVGNDLVRLNPTIMLVVPRFLDAMRGRILDAMEKAPPLRQKMFAMALREGTKKFRGGTSLLHPILDALVGKKVRARLGTNFRFFVSGGAALPAQTAEFFGAFGITILQGYGLTETCSGVCLNRVEDNDTSTLGVPLAGVEMKLAEDGEILIRGDCLMLGYYNLPEETAAVIDADGWFHSGDLGVKLPDGKYKITDRKKDILVLSNGKNVAPQPIENLLRESAYIQEAVLFGDELDHIVGLILPDEAAIGRFAQEQGLPSGDLASMVQHDAVKQLIKTEVDKVNKKVADFEKVKKHALIGRAFSVEGGELTPSLKVKRRVVKEMYAEVLKGFDRG